MSSLGLALFLERKDLLSTAPFLAGAGAANRGLISFNASPTGGSIMAAMVEEEAGVSSVPPAGG